MKDLNSIVSKSGTTEINGATHFNLAQLDSSNHKTYICCISSVLVLCLICTHAHIAHMFLGKQKYLKKTLRYFWYLIKNRSLFIIHFSFFNFNIVLMFSCCCETGLQTLCFYVQRNTIGLLSSHYVDCC